MDVSSRPNPDPEPNPNQEGARLKMDLSSRKERLEKKRFHLQVS